MLSKNNVELAIGHFAHLNEGGLLAQMFIVLEVNISKIMINDPQHRVGHKCSNQSHQDHHGKNGESKNSQLVSYA